MQSRSGIELEAVIAYTMEQQGLPGSLIEAEMRHQARNHLQLDMGAQGLWNAAENPNTGLYEVRNYDDTFKRRMRKFKRDTSRSSRRLNLFPIPHFKTWINPKKKIDLVAIGGESPGRDFVAYKTYIDERIEIDLDQICMGEVKVYPVGEVNNRLICILKEDVHKGREFYGVQTVAKVYIPRSEVCYLFYLHLVQKEELKNVLTRYRREDLAGNPSVYINWEELGIEHIGGGFTYAWTPPNCIRYEPKPMNFLLENDMYPPIPEAEDPNFGDKKS
jgi:hypothetical protein